MMMHSSCRYGEEMRRKHVEPEAGGDGTGQEADGEAASPPLASQQQPNRGMGTSGGRWRRCQGSDDRRKQREGMVRREPRQKMSAVRWGSLHRSFRCHCRLGGCLQQLRRRGLSRGASSSSTGYKAPPSVMSKGVVNQDCDYVRFSIKREDNSDCCVIW